MEERYFILAINKENGHLRLYQGESVIEDVSWAEARQTSEEIFEAAQKILQKTGLSYQDVPELRLDLDLPPHSTARRIAETIQNVYNGFVTK